LLCSKRYPDKGNKRPISQCFTFIDTSELEQTQRERQRQHAIKNVIPSNNTQRHNPTYWRRGVRGSRRLRNFAHVTRVQLILTTSLSENA